MDLNITAASFVLLTFIITGVTISLVLWLFAKDDNKANRILSMAILTMTISVAVRFMWQTNLILEFSQLYRVDGISLLISFPLIFFYVSSVALKAGAQPSDYKERIPIWFYLINLMPFLILSIIESEQLMQTYLSNRDEMPSDAEWLTASSFQFRLHHAVMLFFLLLQFRIITICFKGTTRKIKRKRLQLRSWLTWLTASQTLAFLPLIFKPENPDAQWILSTVALNIPIPVTTIWLFLRPGILYGLDTAKQDVDRRMKPHTVTNENGSTTAASMTPSQQQLSERLYHHMITTQKFLEHRYTINRLAAELDIPPHQISAFLNQHLQNSFSDFLNKFRIEYCIQRIKNGDARRLTLEALASECGFNNRNSFTAAFRRMTGVTPSEFMKQMA